MVKVMNLPSYDRYCVNIMYAVYNPYGDAGNLVLCVATAASGKDLSNAPSHLSVPVGFLKSFLYLFVSLGHT